MEVKDMTKTRTRALALILGATLTFGVVCAAVPEMKREAYAVDTATEITYPFATGTNAFQYAPTFTMATELGAGGNKWEYVEVKTDAATANVQEAEYFAIQIRVDKGDPGLTLGFIENGDRFNNSVDEKKMYFVEEDGDVRELSVLYSAVNLGANACGMLLIPKASLGWQWNNNSSDLSKVSAFYFTANTQFNANYALTIGSIGYYDGEPNNAETNFVSLADCSKGLRDASKYYVDSANPDCLTFPKIEKVDPFKFAPTFTMATEQGAGGNKWEYVEVRTDAATANVQDAKYFAVDIRVESGNPGLTLGFIENGDRFNNCVDGNEMYFIDEDGTSRTLSVLYSAVNLGEKACGTLIIPKASLGWQWNNNSSDLSKVTAFYFTANTEYNWGYALTIGNVGYYDGELDDEETQYVSLADCSKELRDASKYYVDSANPDCLSFPTDTPEPPAPVAPSFEYPFRTGEGKDLNAARWTGPVVGDSEDNWQKLTVKFDTATVDMSSADYLVIQYHGTAGTPGITYDLMAGSARYSVSAGSVDGEPVYYLGEGETDSKKTANVTYGAVNATLASNMGALIIPMSSMDWVGTAGDLSQVDTLVLQTNSRYNYLFAIVVGEVGLYDVETETFTKILTLDTQKEDKFAVSNSAGTNGSMLELISAERLTIGDSTVDVMGSNTVASVTGSEGSVTTVKDAYDGDALQLKATAVTSDGYTAVMLADGKNFDWSGMDGINFYARNDSDSEVFFNIEIDCMIANGQRARFNILQGNRFWLYDINTGKTSIYMTRPTATLPAGFEGWVRIPFSAFEKASWSTGAVSKTDFMSEGSVVAYLAISIEASKNLNKAFTVNYVGAYETTPAFTSSFIVAEGKTIPELLGMAVGQEEN